MKNFFLFCIIALCIGSLFAQNPAKCYHLDGWDIPHRINKANSNGYAVTGNSDGGAIVLVVDENGNELVKKNIQKNDLHGLDIHALDSSGYIISGFDYIYGEPGFYVPYILRVDPQGNEVWYRELRKQSDSWGTPPITSKLVLKDNLITVVIRDTLLTLDTDGAVVFAKDLQDITLPVVLALDIQYADSYYYVLGIRTFNWSILKISDSFNSATVFNFVPTIKNVNDFILTRDKGFLISGQSSSGDWQLVKLDSTGVIEWEKTYEFQNFSWGYSYAIAETDDGFLMAGTAAKIDPYGWCPLLVKTDKNGNGRWLKELDLCGVNNAADALVIDDGKIIVTGRKHCSSQTGIDVFIIQPDTIPSLIISAEEASSLEKEQFLYPNPFCESLDFYPEGLESIVLFDLLGREIYASKTPGDLNTGNMEDGVYFARINLKNGSSGIQKVIKRCR